MRICGVPVSFRAKIYACLDVLHKVTKEVTQTSTAWFRGMGRNYCQLNKKYEHNNTHYICPAYIIHQFNVEFMLLNKYLKDVQAIRIT